MSNPNNFYSSYNRPYPRRKNPHSNDDFFETMKKKPVVAVILFILLVIIGVVAVYIFKKLKKKQEEESEVIANTMTMMTPGSLESRREGTKLYGPHTPMNCPVLLKQVEEDIAEQNKTKSWGNYKS